MTGDVPAPAEDPWSPLRRLTAARIGLDRAGASLGTAPLLAFRLAHAQARDAVHLALDEEALLAALPCPAITVESQATDRRTYLMRPDLGRVLAEAAVAQLAPVAGEYELAVVLGDGLSALALQRHAGPLLDRLLPALSGWALAPLVLVRGARVAVADALGAAKGERTGTRLGYRSGY